MKYTKPPLTHAEQLDLLISRGLSITDRKQTEKLLNQVGYYRLSAYCIPFEIVRHQFKASTHINSIQQLYEFDRQLRFLLNEALEVLEIAFRSLIAHFLTQKYGPFAHENKSIFYHTFDHLMWISKVHEEANRSKETFISHYKKTYENFPQLPLWISVEIMSLGTLSQIFSGLLKIDQNEISLKINLHSSVLKSWLHTLTYTRNMCAHHSRIWNRELAIAMIIPTKDPRWTGINTRRIASVIYAISTLLKKLEIHNSIQEKWHTDISQLLNISLDIENANEIMGSSDNWKYLQTFIINNSKPPL